MTSDAQRSSWKTRTGFLFAVIGSAVGLGNIWRFPYAMYKNGGGVFLIPYAVALVSIGIPLMIVELSIGHKFRASAPAAFERIGRRWEFFGWWMVTFAFIGIELYYCVIISWCVNYFWLSFGLRWGSGTMQFFENDFLGFTKGPYQLGGLEWPIVLGLAFVWFATWYIIYKGVRKGIEVASKVLVPFLFLIMIALVIWSLTLPGSMDGVKAFFVPDLPRLLEPGVWTDAFSQIFFSLSIGLGIIITYASYLPQKANIRANAVIACLGDTVFALVAGLTVFATLGYMAQASGTSIGAVIQGRPGLPFAIYPEAINHLPLGREAFGALFFLSLISAGITSSISVVESVTSSLMDKFGWSRKRVASGLAVFGFLGGLIFATGAGLYWLDIVDHFVSHFGLLAAGFLEAVIIGWVYRSLPGEQNGLTGWWKYIIAIWVPLVLGLLIVLELIKQVSRPYHGYEWAFVLPVGFGWIVMTLAIAWFLKGRGWKKPPVKEEL